MLNIRSVIKACLNLDGCVMKNNKLTILKIIGLILLITGALLSIADIIAMSCKTNILLGIMMLGLSIVALGTFILLR